MRRSTSDKMYQKILDMLPDRRAEVFIRVYMHGPLTAKELEHKMREQGIESWRDCNKRLSELERQGAIKTCGERQCGITGNTVLTWDVTMKLPKKLQHRPRKRVFKFEIKECCSCLLAAEDEQGEGCCYLDQNISTFEEGRPIECPMDLQYDEFVART